MTDLGIIIIHYGRSAPTLRCVESVLKDESKSSRHIVVVDNFGNLKDRNFPEEVEIIRRPDNPGFGGGANAGAEALKCRNGCLAYVVLNNDVVLRSGFLDATFEAFEDPKTGAAGGPIRGSGEDGKLWYAGGNIRRSTGTVRQSHREKDTKTTREVGFIPGTAIALRLEAWNSVGGFDGSFFLYNEDIDLCLRLREAGWKLRFQPGMCCIHDLGESTGSGVRSALYLEQLTKTRLRPFSPRSYQAYLLLIHSIYNVARISSIFLHQGISGRTLIRAIMRGHMAAMAEVLGRGHTGPTEQP